MNKPKLHMEIKTVSPKARKLKGEWTFEEGPSELDISDDLIEQIQNELESVYLSTRFDFAMSVVDELAKPKI